MEPERAAQLGSFVGGYIGSIFSLGAIVLLFLTLIGQQDSSEKQEHASSLQSFENRYFQLIKLHRDNVTEIKLGGETGRKFFVLALRELRCALAIVKKVGGEHNQKLTNIDLLHIAYYALFFGVGPNSSRMLTTSLSEFDVSFIRAVDEQLNDRSTKKGNRQGAWI